MDSEGDVTTFNIRTNRKEVILIASQIAEIGVESMNKFRKHKFWEFHNSFPTHLIEFIMK